jgi:aryl-alcohol dehydrogenase-like predicted oxidoreductase
MRLRDCRDEITVCTKVNTGGSSENIPRALSASLERLQTGYTDIYKMHSPDQTVPIEETMETMTAEISAGRMLVAGCSNYSTAQLQGALDASASHGYARFEVTQPSYSLAAPEAQEKLLPLCASEEVAATPYGPLGSGFLTGKYTPDRTKFPPRTRFHVAPGHADVYFSDRNFRVVEKLRAKADELGMPMVKLAMAWAMTHPSVTAALIGARETRHIDNAVAAYEMGLDPELRAEMSAWD